MDSPRARQVSVYLLHSSVFIGLPCPKNTTGILEWAFAISRLCQVEQQHFGAFALFEGDFSRVGGFESVARLDGLSVRGKLAARHVQIGAATGLKLVGRA